MYTENKFVYLLQMCLICYYEKLFSCLCSGRETVKRSNVAAPNQWEKRHKRSRQNDPKHGEQQHQQEQQQQE